MIDFGGLTATITDTAIGVNVAARIKLPSDQEGWWHRLPADQPLTVTRPDPDAELVEVMARASYGFDGGTNWGASPDTQKSYRLGASVVLAAAREAGLL